MTTVRPYSGYGPDQSSDFPFTAILERVARRCDPLEIWGSGDQIRDWIHIDDLTAAMLKIVESGTDEAVSLCTGIGISIMQMAVAACEIVGYRPTIKPRRDMPAGTHVRIGDPTIMRRYHRPQKDLLSSMQKFLAERTVS